MRKVIAGFNMTLDGICDHTALTPDGEVHEHYSKLLSEADCMLFGRTTYHLMEFWRPFLDNPSGEKSMDDFAIAIDRIPKIVFSNTLTEVDWKTARVATLGLQEEVLALKQQPGNSILVGSLSLIIALMKSSLIDELQLTVHPVIAVEGRSFFEDIKHRMNLKLINTKTFAGGAVTLYYKPQPNGLSEM